jgi:hypothetical protein
MARKLAAWLQLIGWSHVLGGVSLPWLLHSDLISNYRAQVFQALQLPPEAQPAALVLMSFMGPTIASWGVLFLFMVRTTLPKKAPNPMLFLGWSIIAWAPLDMWLSWQAGIYFNIWLDLLVIAAIAPPMWWLSRNVKASA